VNEVSLTHDGPQRHRERKHYVSETETASFFKQEAPNMLPEKRRRAGFGNRMF